MGFLLGLIIGFLLGASKFRTIIVKKAKELFSRAKKEVENTFKDE